MKSPFLFCAIGILLSCSIAGAAPSFQLAQDGKTDYSILLPENPSEVQEMAAAELADYLRQITGANFPIIAAANASSKPQAKQLIIGPSALSQKLLADAGLAGEDQYGYDTTRIEPVGESIIFTGHSIRGPLYAVYTFLEEHLGCRWWTTEEEFVPHSPTLEIEIAPYCFTPKLYYRDTDYDSLMGEKNVPISVKFKLNGSTHPIPKKYGGKIGFQYHVHSFNLLIPPEKYFLNHPEWFSEIDGIRKVGYSPWWTQTPEFNELKTKIKPEQLHNDGTQLCLTNEEMFQEMLKNALDALSQNPNASIISISQNDGPAYCACEKCRAIDEEEGTHMGSLIRFVNRMAEEIEKVYPDVLVETLAYQYTRKPPKITHARRNVVIRLCSIECSFGQTLNEGRWNAEFKKDIQGWQEKADHLFIWDYVTDFALPPLPFPNTFILKDNIQFYIDNKTIGLFEESDPGHLVGDFFEMKAWVISKLLWNPDLDTGELIDEFIAGYYAPELVPIYHRYHEILANACKEKDAFIGIFSMSASHWLDNDTFMEITRLMNQARTIADRLAKEQPEKYATLPEKVHRERMGVDLLWLNRWKIAKRESEILGTEFLGADDPQALAKDFLVQAQKYQIPQCFTSIPGPRDFDALRLGLLHRFEPTNIAPLPPEFDSEKPERIFDLQECDFTFETLSTPTYREEDPAASNGWAVMVPQSPGPARIEQTEPLLELIRKLDGTEAKIHLYLWARGETSSEEGIAMKVGVSKNGLAHGIQNDAGDNGEEILFEKEIPFKAIQGAEYQKVDLGTFSPEDAYLWLQPNRDDSSAKIWVDRMIFVRE